MVLNRSRSLIGCSGQNPNSTVRLGSLGSGFRIPLDSFRSCQRRRNTREASKSLQASGNSRKRTECASVLSSLWFSRTKNDFLALDRTTNFTRLISLFVKSQQLQRANKCLDNILCFHSVLVMVCSGLAKGAFYSLVKVFCTLFALFIRLPLLVHTVLFAEKVAETRNVNVH